MTLQQYPKIEYTIKITESFYDGFRGIFPHEKGLFKGISIVKDKKILKDNSYKKNQLVRVSVELVDSIKEDLLTVNYDEFYVVVFQQASNGIYTKEYKKNESRFKSLLFYESRGMITSPLLENNYFESGDYVKVTLRKI